MKKQNGLLLGALLFSQTVTTGAWAASDATCTSGKDERKIEIVYSAEGKKVPCEVKYTKAGEAKTLYTANAEEGYCESKAKAFAEKLGGMGFKCEGEILK